jgi:hypothetical protein
LFDQGLEEQTELIFAPAQRRHGLLGLRRDFEIWLIGGIYEHSSLG